MMGASKAPSALQQQSNVNHNQHYNRIINGDQVLDIYGYINNPIKKLLTYLLTIVTCGLVQVIFHWFPVLKLKCTSNECYLNYADSILIKDDHNVVTIKHIKKTTFDGTVEIYGGNSLKLKNLRYFKYKKVTYIWHPTKFIFTSLESLEGSIPISYFHSIIRRNVGYSIEDVTSKLLIYGKNLIEVKLNPIPLLLIREVITPFYMFQIFSVTIWYCDNYAYYASIIIVMSMLSIISDVIQIRKQEKKLRAMVHSESYVKVLRNNGKIEEINSIYLVPGDILLVPSHGCNLQCDAVLMNGTVIVNEAMLTGESVPVTKVPLPEEDYESNNDRETIFSLKEHSRHVLFCGTTVLQSRNHGGRPATAIVLRTAYSTLKGELVRSIMYPKPVDFSFTKDLFKFIFFLAGIACCGFGYTIFVMYLRGASLRKIIVRTLDIVTIVVPPALPAAMSIGILNAQMRLKLKEIFCISPSTINTCGAINIVCFDKTGTLTEDGLDFYCYKPVNSDSNGKPTFGEEGQTFNDENHLTKAIATCHSLTKIEEELCGDPLDVILFDKSGFVLEESGEDDDVEETARFDLLQPTIVRSKSFLNSYGEPLQLAIIRQFTFSSSLQRMTVLVHNIEDGRKNLQLYSKGAPEMIASLCDPASIPENYTEIVNNYAQHGYRLIAVAYRNLEMSYSKAQKVNRDEVECSLQMLGLIAMENRIKDQTLGVINQLNNAKIRTVMVTGDNLLTALSVARDCGIIRPSKLCYIIDLAPGDEKTPDGRKKIICREAVSSSEDNIEEDTISTSSTPSIESGTLVNSAYHLAISGPTFSVVCHEYPELLDKLVCVCDVYARMSPDQKQYLINKLQEVHYTVAMCGDGANDCAALKAAHAGISLSPAEASIAAPFTSKIPDIRCVPHIIREGRAALVTSFGIFKYMAGYSLTQFITIMHLYWLGTNLTDFEFLYIDLLLITLVAITFGATPACSRLSKTPPPTRLLSLGSVLSILGQLTIIGAFQMFTFIYVSYQSWFIPYSAPITATIEDKRSQQGTAIFCVSTFQYITLAIIYSKGKPYRKSILSNRWLMISLITMSLISVYITLYPANIVIKFMEFDPIPLFSDRLFFFFIGILSAISSYIFEMFVINYLILSVREKRIKEKRIINDENPRSYETILSQISTDTSWIKYIFSCKRSSNSQSTYYTPSKSKCSGKSNSSSYLSSTPTSKFCTPTKSIDGLLIVNNQNEEDDEITTCTSRTMTLDSTGSNTLLNNSKDGANNYQVIPLN
uniref:Cation-transporting ATPase n=1 Tax=Strongyloides venezuelensis TaxID=75913 RepID=A0A0K0EYM5_STRVS